jgi:NAD(P)H-dependent nitrite reductase small subunit
MRQRGESRGLAFLQKARPDAMAHLLSFFKESGRHLEPKTRFLISVVTKVINFSPRGLRQYVRRALGEGATADEVLSAVMCAYPCAGLTRVVDAVDVILEMGIADFDALGAGAGDPDGAAVEAVEAGEAGAAEAAEAGGAAGAETAGRQGGWVEIAAPGEIPAGGTLRVVIGTRDLALFRLAEAVHAIDNTCPHKGGFLSQGTLSGGVVTCPLHGWKFHLATGDCLNRPGTGVRSYPVRVLESGKVEVKLP